MGRGIVDPVDGLSETQTPSVPELHQALADQLRGQRFDLRRLIRTICSSDAYARTELEMKDAAYDLAVERFAARRPRPLIPEQLIASYSMITRQTGARPRRAEPIGGRIPGPIFGLRGSLRPALDTKDQPGIVAGACRRIVRDAWIDRDNLPVDLDPAPRRLGASTHECGFRKRHVVCSCCIATSLSLVIEGRLTALIDHLHLSFDWAR